LALGTLALALLAATLARPAGDTDRLRLLAVGFLLGAAFWQQPVALSYVAAAGAALVLWRPEPERSSRWWALAGLAVGLLPVVVWNARHEWASVDILGRSPGSLRAQLDAFPVLVERTLTLSFPVLAGASRGHPWWGLPLRWAGTALLPLTFLAYLVVVRTALAEAVERKPSPAVLPALLFLTSLAQFWAVASGAVYLRPRYLLPLVAASAIQLGAVYAALAARARPAALVLLGGLVASNVAGMAERLGQGEETAHYYRQVVRSLERKGVRTGYADFSLSAPVTMITRERILLSSRLGPTPAYESGPVTARVARDGPDAYVLRPDDDPEAFAAVLRRLGVEYRMDVDPVPVFYAFSRVVHLEEVAGFRGDRPPPSAEPDE
jgi:hypothetical protein